MFYVKGAHMRFVMDKLALGEVFSKKFWYSPTNYNATNTPASVITGGLKYQLEVAVIRNSLPCYYK